MANSVKTLIFILVLVTVVIVALLFAFSGKNQNIIPPVVKEKFKVEHEQPIVLPVENGMGK